MKEKREETPAEEVRRLEVVLLRYAKNLDQAELSRLVRLSTTQISNYERAIHPVRKGAVERVAKATGFPLPLLGFLERGLYSFVLAARGRSRSARALAEWHFMERLEVAREIADLLHAPLARRQPAAPRPPRAEDRVELAPQVAVFRDHCTPKLARLLMEEAAEYRRWPLGEQAGLKSAESVASDPQEARAWAALAVDIATGLAGEGASEEAWRWRLQGWALLHLAGAERAGGDRRAAETARARGQALWEAGESGDPGLLTPLG